MDAEKILAAVNKRPFEPFCICLTDGTRYEVWHPDQIMLERRACHVGTSGRTRGVFRRIDLISNIHITHFEPLESPRSESA